MSTTSKHHPGVCTVCGAEDYLHQHTVTVLRDEQVAIIDTQWICNGCVDFLVEYREDDYDDE